jgi:hypothetical protein
LFPALKESPQLNHPKHLAWLLALPPTPSAEMLASLTQLAFQTQLSLASTPVFKETVPLLRTLPTRPANVTAASPPLFWSHLLQHLDLQPRLEVVQVLLELVHLILKLPVVSSPEPQVVPVLSQLDLLPHPELLPLPLPLLPTLITFALV